MRFIDKKTHVNLSLTLAQERGAPLTALEAIRRWSRFDSKETHTQLLYEQSDLCAYTEVSIGVFAAEHNSKGAHVEHIAPKSSYPARTFDYQNLVLSVMDSNDLQKFAINDQFGGHFKGNKYNPLFFISPLNPDCRTFFNYLSNGFVEPAMHLTQVERVKADYTIKLLNLNAAYLCNKRKQWIEELNIEIDNLIDDENALAILAECELCETTRVKLRPFHSAARQCFGRLGEAVIALNCPNCL
ncbi:retron system putative HNH endonuclease [Rouxiella sp. T17]|uniref:retron system putative HNH endonuclease n=1 Tax=Rouxiella sp. T17 TaxID=3085684 RepID=UPI002FC611EF